MTLDLFSSCPDPQSQDVPIELPDSDILYFPAFLSADIGWDLFAQLKSEIDWRQEDLHIYGRVHKTPRLTAWYGEPHKIYTYSGLSVETLPWTSSLLTIKAGIEALVKQSFNSVLLNLYRSGADGVSWHSDNERELGDQPVIASLSLGETRPFQLRHKNAKDLKASLSLAHGDLLLMRGMTQDMWQHQIPKSKKVLRERINLTFRTVY